MLTVSSSLRLFFALFLAMMSSLLTALPAKANNKYAAIVMHADTGDVLFSRYARHKRYPASLTKMMTLYLLFEEMEASRVMPHDTLKISRRAATQPASKLNAKAGSRITVEQAIQALIIKSANDIAVAVAENLSGSETAFARRMTRKARQLGMYRTTFRNASGLPNYKQVSTARDLALLSQRLIQDFPQYHDYFQQTSFRYLGKVYTSHNKLVRQYKGTNGLKTGYTRRSGYNLATSVQRGDHQLIGIVLGGRSGATRDRHMKKILSNAFTSIRKNPKRIKASHLRRPIPTLKPSLLKELGGQWPPTAQQNVNVKPRTSLAGHDKGGQLATTTAPIQPPRFKTAEELNAHALEMMRTKAKEQSGDAVGEGDIDASPIRNWSVQLGAYTQRSLADSALKNHEHIVREAAAILDKKISVIPQNGASIFRARFTNLTQEEAAHICHTLHEKGTRCLSLHAQ